MTQSIVLRCTDLLHFIDWLLDTHKLSATLVVCSTKNEFIYDLSVAISQAAENSNKANTKVAHDLLFPPLRLLSESHSITVVYCPSIFSLFAYLSVYKPNPPDASKYSKIGSFEEPTRSSMLVLLNPISLFSNAQSQFSARGVGRLFASAYEAAARSRRDLVVVECPRLAQRMKNFDTAHPERDAEVEKHENAAKIGLDETNVTNPSEEDEIPVVNKISSDRLIDPWNQCIPILGSGDKKQGSVEGRWFERSISVRAVVARWCDFESMSV